MPKTKRTIYRNSESGQFVPKAYVESHGATTETEHWPMKATGERTIYRSAKTGKFVDRAETKKHRATTETEHRRS